MGLKNLLGGQKKEKFFIDFSEGTSAPKPPAPQASAPKPEVKPDPKPEPKPAKAAKAPEAKAPAVTAPAAPVAPAIAPPPPKPAPVLTTFAPEYLIPTAGASRRRPGPSLTMFKDMARSMGR
ncbi:MAG: hypothetical protein Fur0042_11950 [Cyanophyceae cyanobacterium]